MIGHIKWFDTSRGFGFILDYHNNKEIFVGRHAIIVNDTFKAVGEGQPVSYEVLLDDKGREHAVQVMPLSIDDILLIDLGGEHK